MQSKRCMVSDTATTDKPVAEIYFGGAGDESSRLVLDYVRRRAPLMKRPEAGRAVLYFAHYQLQAALREASRLQSEGHRLALIGHSWGSDAALRLAAQIGGPLLLIAADPVAKPGLSLWQPRPDPSCFVLHLDAAPNRPDTSDQVKSLGLWAGGGLARIWQDADITITTRLNHWNFAGMMTTPGPDGATAEDWLLAYPPATRPR